MNYFLLRLTVVTVEGGITDNREFSTIDESIEKGNSLVQKLYSDGFVSDFSELDIELDNPMIIEHISVYIEILKVKQGNIKSIEEIRHLKCFKKEYNKNKVSAIFRSI